MENPLLSLVIPTKDRANNLIEILTVIFSYNWDISDVEIIVQDNSYDNSRIVKFLNSNDSTSIVKYFYSDKNMSQAENSNLACLNAKGEFLCFIGDDDCVHKDIIYVVKWMKRDKFNILINKKPEFIWSNMVSSKFTKSTSGMFYSFRYSGTYSIKNCDDQLSLLLNNGGQYIYNLPQFYHGIVNKRILESVFKETGTYFPGPSPDMAVATALTKFSDSYVVLDFPLIISGKSVNSVGGLGIKGKHIGNISEIPFLPFNTSLSWTKFIPFYWSGSTIFAESAVKSLIKTNREYLLDNFNFNYLYARCLVFDLKYLFVIISCVNGNPNSSWILIVYYFFNIWMERLKIFIINRSFFIRYTDKKIHNNVRNFSEVFNILEVETKNINRFWLS